MTGRALSRTAAGAREAADPTRPLFHPRRKVKAVRPWLLDLSHRTRVVLAHTIEEYLLQERLQDYEPYIKQLEFHAAGKHHLNRLLRANNQAGKTLSASAETAYHLTGEYPEWWPGHVYDRPILAWCTGETAESVRDLGQKMLVGEPDRWGTGFIPSRCLTSMLARASGVGGLLDYIRIRHVSGGTSLLKFRYYAQSREAWQGPPVDWLWWDEEPPEEKHAEGMARTIATQGRTALTYTPIKGRTRVTKRYIEREGRPANYHDTKMTIHDCPHLAGRIEMEKARWPEHEHSARLFGEPMAGEGLIYPYTEEQIAVDPFDIPFWWPQIAGLDFGYDHPAGAAVLAYDRESDIVYVIRVYRESGKTPQEQCLTLKHWGEWLKWAWPRDGHTLYDKDSGLQYCKIYRREGLKMLPIHAQYEEISEDKSTPRSRVSIYRGILDIQDRMRTGRFKVFRGCREFFEEMRLYHLENHQVVKVEDDVLDAVRYGVMMLRFAAPPRPPVMHRRPPPNWRAH